MTGPVRATFAAFVFVQAAHSTEEYFGRLWEAVLPAQVVSLVFSSNPQRGFLIANVVIVGFGFWCAMWPVNRGWRVAPALVSASLLLVLALRLAYLLRRQRA